MSDLRERPGDQPLPIPNGGPSIQSLVRADLDRRERVGIQRHGTPLQAFNGRDALRDAYEEALDLATYLRQVIEEQRARAADFTSDELRSLCASLDRIREAAGVGPDTDIEDLVTQVSELRQGRDEARVEVVSLGQSVALTVAEELRRIGHTPGIPEGGWRWILDHANELERMANSVADLLIQDGTPPGGAA